MSTDKNAELVQNSLFQRARRLNQIGEIFLDLGSGAQQTGKVDSVFDFRCNEDQRYPVIKNPQSEQQIQMREEALVANARADAMPTTIQNHTVYSIGEVDAGGVKIVSRTQRVDLGYKVGRIAFNTGSPQGNMLAAAGFVTDRITSQAERTRDAVREDQWNRALTSTVLADHATEVVFDHKLLGIGQLLIVQHDNITGLVNPVQINLNDPDTIDDQTARLLHSLEFNLISTLQQKRFEAEPEMANRIDAVINSL